MKDHRAKGSCIALLRGLDVVVIVFAVGNAVLGMGIAWRPVHS